jgi:hypothetical protein
MTSGSIVQDLNRLYAPIVTYLSIEVSAGRPVLQKNACIRNSNTLINHKS